MLPQVKNIKYAGIIYPLVDRVFRLLEIVTPLGLLRYISIRRLHRKWFVLYSPLAVDLYVCLWLALEASMLLYPFVSVVIPRIFTYVFAWRIVDIVQAWFNVTIRPPSNISSSRRLFILVLLNYVEIAMIFAVMIFSFQTNFMPHPYYMFDAFFSSLTILLPVISPVVTPISLVGLAMYYGEIFISLIFFIVIIQRTLVLFTIKD